MYAWRNILRWTLLWCHFHSANNYSFIQLCHTCELWVTTHKCDITTWKKKLYLKKGNDRTECECDECHNLWQSPHSHSVLWLTFSRYFFLSLKYLVLVYVCYDVLWPAVARIKSRFWKTVDGDGHLSRFKNGSCPWWWFPKTIWVRTGVSFFPSIISVYLARCLTGFCRTLTLLGNIVTA